MDTASLEAIERGGHCIHAQSFVIERYPDGIDAEPGEAVERAEIGDLLHQHGVAARQQKAVDKFDALERARSEENLIGCAGNPGVAPELFDQELAQSPVAERAAFEPVSREHLALALEHRGSGCDQLVDRNLLRIIVAADEIVLGKPSPLDRRCWQAGCQKGSEVELCS